jgi:hypothetical protein
MATFRKHGHVEIHCDECNAWMSWWTVSGLCTKCYKAAKIKLAEELGVNPKQLLITGKVQS